MTPDIILQRTGIDVRAVAAKYLGTERMAEHIRYMVETIAHHQVDIDSEV